MNRPQEYWVFQQGRNMIGHDKKVCMQLGQHILVPQVNQKTLVIHQFCYNCGKEIIGGKAV